MGLGRLILDTATAGFDTAGFDVAGFDGAGFDGAGFDGAGFDGAALDGAGFDSAGFDTTGLDAAGFKGVSSLANDFAGLTFKSEVVKGTAFSIAVVDAEGAVADEVVTEGNVKSAGGRGASAGVGVAT